MSRQTALASRMRSFMSPPRARVAHWPGLLIGRGGPGPESVRPAEGAWVPARLVVGRGVFGRPSRPGWLGRNGAPGAKTPVPGRRSAGTRFASPG